MRMQDDTRCVPYAPRSPSLGSEEKPAQVSETKGGSDLFEIERGEFDDSSRTRVSFHKVNLPAVPGEGRKRLEPRLITAKFELHRTKISGSLSPNFRGVINEKPDVRKSLDKVRKNEATQARRAPSVLEVCSDSRSLLPCMEKRRDK